MSKFITVGLVGVFVLLNFSGCAKVDKPKKDTQYYDRANKAASESHKGLDKD